MIVYPFITSMPQSNTGVLNVANTVTAQMATGPNAAAATGTVQLLMNSTPLGAPLPLSGNPAEASVANITFPQGNFTITANYSGDNNYNPVSTTVPSSWGVPLGWTANATSATINPGQTATFNVTLSNFNYSGTVPLMCVAGTSPNPQTPVTPPAGVQCNLSVSQANLAGNSQSVPVTVTVTTTTLSQLSPWPFTAPPVCALVLWGFRRKQWRRMALCVAAALAIGGITSCGGSGSTGPPPPPATTAVYTVFAQVTTGSSGVTDTSWYGVTLTVNINQ